MDQEIKLNEFNELEYKYKADNVGLGDFKMLMEELGYKKYIDVSSWDYYFTKENNPEEFIRYRAGKEKPELTIKRKTTNFNNWNRVEVDLPLDPSKINLTTVENFVKLEKYSENFRIYKSCFIYFQDYVSYVYYIVWDAQMREKGRFIEVEVNKDKIPELNNSPLDLLKIAENSLQALSITHNNRLKKSLFEMFRK